MSRNKLFGQKKWAERDSIHVEKVLMGNLGFVVHSHQAEMEATAKK